jgi:hypothetical protein
MYDFFFGEREETFSRFSLLLFCFVGQKIRLDSGNFWDYLVDSGSFEDFLLDFYVRFPGFFRFNGHFDDLQITLFFYPSWIR